ncbi:MAG: hypothetical protein V1908_01455 [Candidatus Peregrinibacteria bacterium]
MLFYCRFSFSSGFQPQRLTRIEEALPAPDTQTVEARLKTVQEDVTRSIPRRAQITRNHLEENGLQPLDVGLGSVDVNDNDAMVKAVLELQIQLFPNDPTEQDGMFGQRTYLKYKEKLESLSTDAVRAKLQNLRIKIDQGREALRKWDGDMVVHEVKEDNADIVKCGITADVIQAAQNDCKKPSSIDDLAAKENFNKVVQYAAKVTDVPPALITAITWAETGGTFSQKGFGAYQELGMGHFLKRYWREYTSDKRFVDAMKNVTTMDDTQIRNIGRARSIVADLVAIGIKLKETVTRLNIDFDYSTDVSAMSNEDLMKIRFHYYAPGYAYALWVNNTHGENYLTAAQHSYDGVKGNLQTRFADKAKQAYEKLKPIQ